MRDMMSPGFTLVEVTLVLGIVSALVILAFVGQGEIRSRAKMTDAVDRTVVALSKAQNDANTTQNNGPGNRSGIVFFGQWVQFTNDSSDVTIQPLWRGIDQDCISDDITDPACKLTELLDDPKTTFTVPNGVKAYPFNSGNFASIVFARDRNSGQPLTYISNNNDESWPTNLANSAYKDTTLNEQIELNDGHGHTACITVTRSGFIDKKYAACS